MGLKLPFSDPKRGFDTRDKIIALIKAKGDGHRIDEDIIKWLYNSLSILDGKANGLLRVNGFFLALLIGALAFFRFVGEGNQEFRLPEVYLFDLMVFIVVISLLFLCSSMVCIGIVRVSWRILGKVSLEAAEKGDFSEEIDHLSHAVDDRVRLYQSAWWLSIVGIALITFSVISGVVRYLCLG